MRTSRWRYPNVRIRGIMGQKCAKMQQRYKLRHIVDLNQIYDSLKTILFPHLVILSGKTLFRFYFAKYDHLISFRYLFNTNFWLKLQVLLKISVQIKIKKGGEKLVSLRRVPHFPRSQL